MRPLAKELFEFEIDDLLLEQYYLQIQKFVDSSPYTNPNYKIQIYYLDVTTDYKKLNESELTIVPNFLKYREIITNDSNAAKLIINILNSLSLWLSLSITDLHVYIFKLFSFVKNFHFLLLKLESCLRPNKFLFN